jgi:hypothetical protein
MSQGNSLYNYLKETKNGFFSFTKLENESRTGPVLGVGSCGRGKDVGK